MNSSHSKKRRHMLSFEPLESRRVLAAILGTPASFTASEVLPTLARPSRLGSFSQINEVAVQPVAGVQLNFAVQPVDSAQPSITSQPVVADLPVTASQIEIGDAANEAVVAGLPEIRQSAVDTTFAGLAVDVSSNATVEAVSNSSTISLNEIKPVAEFALPIIEPTFTGDLEGILGRFSQWGSDSPIQDQIVPLVDGSNLALSTSSIDLSPASGSPDLGIVDRLTSEFDNSDSRFDNFEDGIVDTVITRDIELDLNDGSGIGVGYNADLLVPGELIIGRSETPAIGSGTIIDDPDQTPTIEPDFDTSGEGMIESVVSGTVDIERSLAAANLDLVSRHVVMPPRSPLALPTDSKALANVELADPGEYAHRRAHFSTHAAIASFRRMEIAEFQPINAQLNRMEMAESEPVDSRQYSQDERIWESGVERAEVVVPMNEAKMLPVPKANGGPVGGVPVSEATSSYRTDRGFDLANPLVMVPLLVFSCLGGLVVNRNLDPSESRAFEHRL